MVVLGNYFGVSRETVRHGLKRLASNGVISLRPGRVGHILSREKAIRYLNQVEQKEEIKIVYQEITDIINQQESELDKIKYLLDNLIQKLSCIYK